MKKLHPSEKLKHFIEKNKLTQKEFAGLVGCTQPLISMYLSGVRPKVSPEVAYNIEIACNKHITRDEILFPDLYQE